MIKSRLILNSCCAETLIEFVQIHYNKRLITSSISAAPNNALFWPQVNKFHKWISQSQTQRCLRHTKMLAKDIIDKLRWRNKVVIQNWAVIMEYPNVYFSFSPLPPNKDGWPVTPLKRPQGILILRDKSNMQIGKHCKHSAPASLCTHVHTLGGKAYIYIYLWLRNAGTQGSHTFHCQRSEVPYFHTETGRHLYVAAQNLVEPYKNAVIAGLRFLSAPFGICTSNLEQMQVGPFFIWSGKFCQQENLCDVQPLAIHKACLTGSMWIVKLGNWKIFIAR